MQEEKEDKGRRGYKELKGTKLDVMKKRFNKESNDI